MIHINRGEKSLLFDTAHMIYVAKNGDDNNTGTIGDPFLTIGAANDAAISLLNPILDWEEAVVINVAPGMYTEHIVNSHRRVFIVGNTYDLENWRHDVIIENTGVDEAHYPFALNVGLNLIGLTVQVDSGGIYGVLPNKTVCSVCQFRNGYFLPNTNDTDDFSAYFNYCVFGGDAFRFEGVNDRSEFIALRHCDIFLGANTIFSSTGTGTRDIKLENTKIGSPLSISGDWSTVMMWSELYSDAKLTFDTNGFVDIFASTMVNGVHFYSDTPETKKVVNCIFKNTPVGEGDITADESVEFIEYSGNHQHNGIDGEIITVSKIKNVGGGQNMYRNIHEALQGSLLTDTIINLEGDVEISEPLTINPNIDVQIDGNKKWKLTTTHGTTLVDLTDNQELLFVNLKQIVGGKIAIINGNNASLSFIGCGRQTEPNYVNVRLNNGNIASALHVSQSIIVGTVAPAVVANNINVGIYIDGSLIEGASGEPAIEFNVEANDKLKGKFSTFIHGSGGTNSPIEYTGAGRIDYAIYSSAFNEALDPSDFHNTITSPNNTQSAEIDF